MGVNVGKMAASSVHGVRGMSDCFSYDARRTRLYPLLMAFLRIYKQAYLFYSPDCRDLESLTGLESVPGDAGGRGL